MEELLGEAYYVGSVLRLCNKGKVKPDVENIRGLNFVVFNLTTVQVTKLPFKHKIRKIAMICSVKPVLTKDLCVEQKEEFSVTCYMCVTYTWQKSRHIHKRQTHLLIREDVT
jgi:hypothetical protein